MIPITVNDNAGTAARRETANRQNATHSTGPKTPEGKVIVSRNSLKHGLYSRTVLLPTENRAEFDNSFTELCRILRPLSTAEDALVHGLHESGWRMHRIRRLEVFLLSLGLREQAAKFLDEPDPEQRDALRLAAAFSAKVRLLDHLRRHEVHLLREQAGLHRQLDSARAARLGQPDPAESSPAGHSPFEPPAEPPPDSELGFVPANSSTLPLPTSAMPVFTGELRSFKRKQWLRNNAKYGAAGPPTA